MRQKQNKKIENKTTKKKKGDKKKTKTEKFVGKVQSKENISVIEIYSPFYNSAVNKILLNITSPVTPFNPPSQKETKEFLKD